MFNKTIGQRLIYLLDLHRCTIDDVAHATGIARSYLYDLKNDKKENPSATVLELIADFFAVAPAFFSRNPKNYVPPIPTERVHLALRATGDLDEKDMLVVEELLTRARTRRTQRTSNSK